MLSLTESKVITGKSQTYKKTPEIVFNICAQQVLRGCVHLFTEVKQTKNRSLQWVVHLSCDAALWHWSPVTLFWQLPIDHNVDVHYQVKHRMYNVLDTYSNAQSLQENLVPLAANQRMPTIAAI